MKILVIDDALTQRLFLKASLAKLGHEVALAVDGHEGVAEFARFDPDLVLLDVLMPGIDGYETARVIRGASDEWVPIIFVSGCHSSEDIEAAIDAGGDDYLTKPCDSKVLEAKIRSMERIVQMRRQLVQRSEELKSANAALMRLIDIDGLTGIANRRHLDRKLTEEVGRCARNRVELSVLLLDIDNFKRFNDSHGHLAGDECLKSVAQALAGALHRPADLAARYGGEEFCVVLPETVGDGAMQVAERLRRRVAGLNVTTPQGSVQVTVSIGVVSQVPPRDAAPAALLSCADAALYRAKAGGRNRVCRAPLESNTVIASPATV